MQLLHLWRRGRFFFTFYKVQAAKIMHKFLKNE